jgi:hypothetical protein
VTMQNQATVDDLIGQLADVMDEREDARTRYERVMQAASTAQHELESLQNALSEAREALEFYADPETHRAKWIPSDDDSSERRSIWPILEDGGRRARIALGRIDTNELGDAYAVRGTVSESMYFSGDMDSDIETWLGDALESWVPSRRQLVITIGAGVEMVVEAGRWIFKDANGVRVGDAP